MCPEPGLSYRRLVGRRGARARGAVQCLRELVTPDWEFCPYIHDRGAEVFARELGLLTGSRFVAEGGAELLNSKVVFRALAAGAGFAVPEGIPCRTTEGLLHTLHRLLAEHPAVILKRDRAVGGHGNTVITTDPHLEGTGAQRTIALGDPADNEQVLNLSSRKPG